MFLQASAGGTAGSSSGEQDCAQKGRREISEDDKSSEVHPQRSRNTCNI